ncbi:hypothetical protein Avbf_17492 [Armadillidium vulgare]|nr:hypothetical protein Avbf_17492 [Armadillidium vulgare]
MNLTFITNRLIMYYCYACVKRNSLIHLNLSCDEGYCDPSDAVCMKAWTKCHGEQLEGNNLLLLKVFWATKIKIANECLVKYGEEPIGITFPNEDPDGGAPGGSDQFHGLLELRLNKIANPETAVNVDCCYVESSEFLINRKDVNEKTFVTLINQRFHKDAQVLQSHMNALQTCKKIPIKNCDMVPFRDCMYKTCIAEIRTQFS